MKQWIWIALLALGLASVAMPTAAAPAADELEAISDRAEAGDSVALARLKKMAKQGDADAQNNLGVSYAEGRGVPQDGAQAVAWFRKAAEQGHAGAQAVLDELIRQGRGQPHGRHHRWQE